jgi:hypothetical protein
MKGFVVGHTEQNTIGAEVFNEIHLLNNFTWIGAGAADEKRNAFFYRLDGGDGQCFEFIKEQIVALAIGSRGCDVVDAVFDDLVDPIFKIVHCYGLRRSDIYGIRRGKGGHHS